MYKALVSLEIVGYIPDVTDCSLEFIRVFYFQRKTTHHPRGTLRSPLEVLSYTSCMSYISLKTCTCITYVVCKFILCLFFSEYACIFIFNLCVKKK